MCRTILIAILLLTLITTTHAQPDSLWSRTYGGELVDRCYSVIQTADSGFALAGGTQSSGAGFYDFWLIRIDPDGDILWSQTYGGEGWDECNSFIQTADGGFALAGVTQSFGAGSQDFWLVRTDSEGDSLWSRTFGGGGIDCCHSIIQTADSGFVLVGYSESFCAEWGDFWMVRTDRDGDLLWSRAFGGIDLDWCSSIIQTVEGGFALAGGTYSFGAGNSDFFLVCTDADGEPIWSQTYGGESDEECYSLIMTSDSGFALAGETFSFGERSSDFWLVRTDGEGDSLWSKSFGGRSRDWCNSIIRIADGGFALAGFTGSLGAGLTDFWLMRTDSDGDSLWSRTFGEQYYDICQSVIQTSDGGFALAGYTYLLSVGFYDAWLVKTGPDPVSVPESDFIPHPSSFTLHPAYPNPFNSETNIRYQLPAPGHVVLTILDIKGRELEKLVDGRIEAGYHRTVWDASELPSGIYFYRLEAGSFTSTRKLMLIK